MQTIKHKNLTWIDIAKPSDKDFEFISSHFDFHPLDLEDLGVVNRRPKFEQHGHYFFLIIHIPIFDRKERKTYAGELEIFATENYIVTIHRRVIQPLRVFYQQCNLHDEMRKKFMSRGPGYLLYELLDHLLESNFPKLDHIAENIDKIEDEIFKGREKEVVREISLLRRDVSEFRRIIKPQRAVFKSLSVEGPVFFKDHLAPYYSDLVNRSVEIWNALDNSYEIINNLFATNESLLSFKISEQVRILTIISAVLLPASLIATIMGANIGGVPWANDPLGFLYLLVTVVLIASLLLVLFKIKKWL